MRLPCRVLFAALLCLGSASARADFERGTEALRRGDHAAALRLLVPAADGGDARASALLADLHERGLGTRRDPDQAFRWRHAAAERGHVPSAVRLGQMFARGDGVARSDEAARQWYRVAAEAGVPEAQLELSKLLGAAGASEADARESRLWYDRAVANGAAVAQSPPLPEAPAAGTLSGPTVSDLRAQRAMRDAWRGRAAFGVGPGWSGVHGWHDPLWVPWIGPAGGPAFGWGWSVPVAPGIRFGGVPGYRW